MITPKFLILVVCLLQAQRAFAFNYAIDLERCEEDTACFLHGSCINTTSPDGASFALGQKGHLVYFKPTDKVRLADGVCDVKMQIKPFTKKKLHVMIEVSGEGLKDELGITFTQSEVLFECRSSPSGTKQKLTPEPLGDSTFSKSRMFCSIVIQSAGSISDLFDEDKYVEDLPTLTYGTATDSEQKIVYETGKGHLWDQALGKVSCDPAKVTSPINSSSSEYKLYETDTTLSKFKCSENKFLVLKQDFDYIPVTDFGCDKLKYTYRKKSEDDPVKLPVGSNVQVFCAEEFCKKCESFECASCAPPPTTEACWTRSCPNGQWWKMEDSGDLSPLSTVECKRSAIDKEKAAWWMGDKEVTKGSCSATFDCKKYANFKFDCPADPLVKDCAAASESDDNVIFCEAGFALNFGDTSTTNLTCDPSKGVYASAEGTKAARNATVYCLKLPPPPTVGAAEMSGGQTAAIAIGVLLAVAAAAGLLICCICWRRRRNAPKTTPRSMPSSDDPNVKTGVAWNSKEGMEGKGVGSKSQASAKSQSGQSGSEAPPSTDRPPSTEPTKEKMPESSDAPKEGKKEEISEDKKEEKKDEKGERKEVKKEKKKPAKITMDMTRKQVPNLRQVNREMEQMKGHEPVDLKPTGKRADASDITPSQLRFAEKPDDKMKHWDETIFQDTLLPAVTIMKPADRTVFLRNLMAFEHHRPGGELECGTLGQFFQVVRRCHDKELDCPQTWEIINRLVKLLCVHLPPKEPVVERMRKMMREVGHMMVKDIGFVRNPRKDNSDDLIKRELACRILLSAEDPVCLEELKKQGDPKPDDIDALPLQTVLYSHALNRMGKKEQMENWFYEELKKGAKEHPKPKDRPFGTARQHLIYALCSDANPEGMVATLEQITDPKSRKDLSKPAGEFNPTELMYAYKGAIENALHYDKVAAVLEAKTDPNFEEAFDAYVDEFAKTQEAKAELTKQLKLDVREMLYMLSENCVGNAQFVKLHLNCTAYLAPIYCRGKKLEFEADKLQSRAGNLETLLKDKKKCAELIDEAMKKAEY